MMLDGTQASAAESDDSFLHFTVTFSHCDPLDRSLMSRPLKIAEVRKSGGDFCLYSHLPFKNGDMDGDFRRPRPPYFKPDFWYVYILRCADDRPYTGYTQNLEDRINRHTRGSVPATKNRRPITLETYFGFSDQFKAIEFEKYLKSGSGRAVMNKRFFKR